MLGGDEMKRQIKEMSVGLTKGVEKPKIWEQAVGREGVVWDRSGELKFSADHSLWHSSEWMEINTYMWSLNTGRIENADVPFSENYGERWLLDFDLVLLKRQFDFQLDW